MKKIKLSVLIVAAICVSKISLAQNFENQNPYTIFGRTCVLGGEKKGDTSMSERIANAVFVIENPTADSPIGRLEHNTRTGMVTFFDRAGKIVGEKLLTDAQRAWLTQDPKAEKRYNISPYTFVSNNPINKFDPDGRDEFYFNGNGEMIERIRNNQPDIFYLREITSKSVYSWTTASDGSIVRRKSFIETTINTPIDMHSNLGYMIRTVYAEAVGANYDSKLAVAEVIRNRANDRTRNSAAHGWAAIFSKIDTYQEVVTQSGQFESVGNNTPRYENPASMIRPNGQRNELETNAFVQSVSAAMNAINNKTNTTQGAMYFYSPYIKAPAWTNSLQQVTVPNVSSNVFKFYRY